MLAIIKPKTVKKFFVISGKVSKELSSAKLTAYSNRALIKPVPLPKANSCIRPMANTTASDSAVTPKKMLVSNGVIACMKE